MSRINPKCSCGKGNNLCKGCLNIYNNIYFGRDIDKKNYWNILYKLYNFIKKLFNKQINKNELFLVNSQIVHCVDVINNMIECECKKDHEDLLRSLIELKIRKQQRPINKKMINKINYEYKGILK